MTEERVATVIDERDPVPPEEGESDGALATDVPEEPVDEESADDIEPEDAPVEAGGEA
jgi:hypothetical protein